MGKSFFNDKLNSLNAVEIDFDASLKSLLLPELSKEDYYTARPDWNSDITWISADSFRSYSVFLECFERLKLASIFAPLIEHQSSIILYSGFFVKRLRCSDYNFHVDWQNDCDNNAFTLIAPLLLPEKSPGLVYYDANHQIKKYSYSLSKAIVFGSGFIHSTDIGSTHSPVVLLSLTFGTDDMKYWDAISKTALSQSRLMRLPCGLFLNKQYH